MKRPKGKVIAVRGRWQVRLGTDRLYYAEFSKGKAGIKEADLSQLAGMFQEAYELSQKKRGHKK